MTRLRLALAVLVVVLTTPWSHAQEAFRWRLRADDKLNYVIQEESSSKITTDGEVFDLKHTLILDTVWRVKQLGPDGQAQIVVTVERVRFNAEGKGAAAFPGFAFDSKEGGEPKANKKTVATILKALVGPEFRLNLNAQGTIARFDVPEAVKAAFENNTARELAGFFGGVCTTDGVRHYLVNWLVAFRGQPVSVGETWTEDKSGPFFGKGFVYNHTYVYSGHDQREGRTVEKMEIAPKFALTDDVRAKADLKIKSQNGRGALCFDAKTGRITHWTLSYKLVLQEFGYGSSVQTIEQKTTVEIGPAK